MFTGNKALSRLTGRILPEATYLNIVNANDQFSAGCSRVWPRACAGLQGASLARQPGKMPFIQINLHWPYFSRLPGSKLPDADQSIVRFEGRLNQQLVLLLDMGGDHQPQLC